MGRIEKTIFILDYITNKSLRRRIQRGLNKGEAMNAFARAIFFGKRREFRERELQLSKCIKNFDSFFNLKDFTRQIFIYG